MSVNSATDSFTEGAEIFDQEKYWSTVRTSIVPDPYFIEAEFNKELDRRITPLSTHGIYAESRLDDVIVRAPSEAFRRHEINQWQAQKIAAKSKHWAWTATAIVSGLAAIAGAIVFMIDKNQVASFANLAFVKTAAGVLIVAGTIFALVSVYFTNSASHAIDQANDLIGKWSADPVRKIGEERNEAYAKGFPYIYSHNLKLGQQPSYTGRFHPKQVEHEYRKYFEKFCRKLLDPSSNSSRVVWMENFKSSNPLSSALMTYGLGSIPEHLKPVIEDYTHFESLLNNIKATYENLKSDVRASAKERCDDYNKHRNSQLQPLAEIRDLKIANAKAERDKIFERHPLSTDPRNKEAQTNYAAIKKATEDDYAVRAAPINRKFDAKIQGVEQEKEAHISKLNDQHNQQLANKYNAARELLTHADAAWKGAQYVAVNFQQYFPYQFGQPAWHGQPLPVQPAPVYHPQSYPQPQQVYPPYSQFPNPLQAMQQAAYQQPYPQPPQAGYYPQPVSYYYGS